MVLGELALCLCLPKDPCACAYELVVEVALVVGSLPPSSVQGIECCAAEVDALETLAACPSISDGCGIGGGLRMLREEGGFNGVAELCLAYVVVTLALVLSVHGSIEWGIGTDGKGWRSIV